MIANQNDSELLRRMTVSSSVLTKFPIGGASVTTGVLFVDEQNLITGHENGVVVSWDLRSDRHRVLYTCSSEIKTISCSDNKELIIGSHGGHIVVLRPNGDYTVIHPPTHNVHDRVWKSLWLDNDSFMTSSTYGELNIFRRNRGETWSGEKLYGHSDSVFSMGRSRAGLLATGDYFGNLLLWSNNQGRYRIMQRMKVQSSIEDIAWFGDEFFATINRQGRICLFEQTERKEDTWSLTSEVGNATSRGSCIHILEDGKTVFAGTYTEVIQFDIEMQQAGSIKMPSVRRIFSVGDYVFVLTRYGLYQIRNRPIEVSPDLIKYKYVKIGLVGHTGVGKSTLCSQMTMGSPGDVKSTLGRKMWIWELPKDNGLSKRIVLQDHGGQETVLSTFLPYLLDSDMILVLFQQNDLTTFNKALRIHDSLQQKIGENVKVFFVQTHIDQKIAEFNERVIADLVKEQKVIENVKICPKDGKGIMDLKRKLLKQISWNKARTMVQSAHSDGVFQTIMSLMERNTSAISLAKFAEHYEDRRGSRIAKSHLKFLLNDYGNRGVLEYNPEVLDLIIFDEPEYNALKTEVPIYAMKKNGVVTVRELNTEFKDSKYLAVIDAMYLRYRTAIENFGRRIFPELLSENPAKLPSNFFELLKNATKETRYLQDQRLDVTNLFAALSDMKLKCECVSRSDGLFSWEENATIHYSFERIGDVLEGFSIRCNYRVAGKSKQICRRLASEFASVLEKLYGPSVKEIAQSSKKKVKSKREIVYDVSISYASEQSGYAQRIADILRAKGIRVFFDRFNEGKMWGRDLSEYLMDVYYKQSLYCIMLISREYISKAWPTHERRSAIARNVESLGEYILPVRFDRSEIPGLPPTTKYLDAARKFPEDVADLFIKKLKHSKLPK